MSNPSEQLLGFWSYKRLAAPENAQLKQAMQDRLGAVIGSSLSAVEIWRDQETRNGIPHGAQWPDEIVRTIARSALFFWNQEAAWLHSAICRFELRMFHAQATRLARQFDLDPQDLFGRLLVPVRWSTMREDQWDQVPERERPWLRALYRDTNILPAMKLADSHLSAMDLRMAAMAIAEPTRDQLFDMPGGLATLRRLLAHAAIPDPTFLRQWTEELAVIRGQLDNVDPPPPRQRAVRLHHPELGVHSFRLDINGGSVRVTEAPLGGRLAEELCSVLPGTGTARHGPDGHWLWSASAASAISQALPQFCDARLPDTATAAALLNLHAKGHDAGIMAGWTTPVANFWCADAGCPPRPARLTLQADAWLPILLVLPTP